MSIQKLFQNKKGGDLSHQEIQDINNCLANMKLEDISREQIRNIIEYLESVLIHGSVEYKHQDKLDLLLEQLRAEVP